MSLPPTTRLGGRTLPEPPPDRRNATERDALVERVRGEFQEIPGLSVTLAQASRLFGISQEICERVLSSLVNEGCVHLTVNGYYRRETSP